MLDTLVYISSDDRSGSTMLELALASHPQIFAAGELHNFPAFIYEDRSFFDPPYELACMCGDKISACNFWKKVESKLPCKLSELKLREECLAPAGFFRTVSRTYMALNYKMRRCRPQFFKHKTIQDILGYKYIARDYFLLYEAIAQASGKKIIIDSSKWPFRFSYLYNYDPKKVKVILLYRNPRAVVFSKFKRGENSIEEAALKWTEIVKQMNFFSESIPASQKKIIRYEDICNFPDESINGIFDFLNIDRIGHIVLRKEKLHHIGGSPSKMDKSSTNIVADLNYEISFSKEQTKKIDNICRDCTDGLVDHFGTLLYQVKN